MIIIILINNWCAVMAPKFASTCQLVEIDLKSLVGDLINKESLL